MRSHWCRAGRCVSKGLKIQVVSEMSIPIGRLNSAPPRFVSMEMQPCTVYNFLTKSLFRQWKPLEPIFSTGLWIYDDTESNTLLFALDTKSEDVSKGVASRSDFSGFARTLARRTHFALFTLWGSHQSIWLYGSATKLFYNHFFTKRLCAGLLETSGNF